MDRMPCSHSLMDRISDSGSDGLGSNPDGSTIFAILRHSVAHGGKKRGKKLKNLALFSLFAQHEHALMGASPQTALIVGRLQRKARVSTVRWNLKEAGSKRLAR